MNWSDPSQPAWSVSPYGSLFAELYRKYVKLDAAPLGGEAPGELLVTGLTPDDLAILVPENPELAEPVGVRAAADGTAWFVVSTPGDYRLHYRNGSRSVRIRPGQHFRKPGYGHVERVNAGRTSS